MADVVTDYVELSLRRATDRTQNSLLKNSFVI